VPTPRGGGCGFVVVSTIASLVKIGSQEKTISMILILGLIISFVGLIDDIHSISIKSRLALQLIIIISLLYIIKFIPVNSTVLGYGFYETVSFLLVLICFKNARIFRRCITLFRKVHLKFELKLYIMLLFFCRDFPTP
jgi:UDP-N-acetylmuramyl pentapeptide phosphotransferase/UDP-N-acetylglucosamine-1-phosphate transferase